MRLEKLIGYLREKYRVQLNATEFHAEPRHVWFWNFEVKESRRNKGTGTAVIAALKDWSVKNQVPLTCEPGSPELIKFYEHRGFKLEYGKQMVFRPERINENIK